MRVSTVTIAVLLAFTVIGCSQDSENAELTVTTTTMSTTTTTTAAAPTTTIGASSEEDVTEDSTGRTGEVGMAIDGYDVIARSSTQEGEVLHVTIAPGNYTDVDLENFVVVTLDERDVAELHVYDDRAAVAASLITPESRTPDEQASIDDHYLVSFTDGNVITFQGPFAGVGAVRIGS